MLTWGPCYYYQKQFFSGDEPLSTAGSLMHHDLEVSGFPSSHAGHLVLLGLKDQDYPERRRIEDWPSWTCRFCNGRRRRARWSGSRIPAGASGARAAPFRLRDARVRRHRRQRVHRRRDPPDTVDFISAGDTPYVWELNIWYHILNVGFRTRVSGETDFPCITDDRVGQARSYAKVDGPLTYRKWIDAVRAGRNYVSDGKSHLMDFAVNGVQAGTGESEVKLGAPGTVKVTVTAAATWTRTRSNRSARGGTTKSPTGIWTREDREQP